MHHDVKLSAQRAGWGALALWAALSLRGALIDLFHAFGTFLTDPVWGPLHATAETVFVVFSLILLNMTLRLAIHPRDRKEADE